MECYKALRLEGIGEPNPGGAGFPEQSHNWCVPAERLKGMFADKKGGSNSSSACSGGFNGLKGRNPLQMNGGLVWMPTEDGKCRRMERTKTNIPK